MKKHYLFASKYPKFMPCEVTNRLSRNKYEAMSREFKDIGFGENFLIVETFKKEHNKYPQAQIYPISGAVPLKVVKFRGEKSADTELQSY